MTTQPAKGTLPTQVFEFSGQTELTTWTLTDRIDQETWTPYEQFLTHEPVLCFQRIRDLADAFPTYQHTPDTGRPPIPERTHLIAMLVRQFLDATFRELKAWLSLLADFFNLDHIPGVSTLSEKNRSKRFTRLLERFNAFLLDQLPSREVVLSTDATGYGNEKLPWSRASYTLRATQGWIKPTARLNCPRFLSSPRSSPPARSTNPRSSTTSGPTSPPTSHPNEASPTPRTAEQAAWKPPGTTAPRPCTACAKTLALPGLARAPTPSLSGGPDGSPTALHA